MPKLCPFCFIWTSPVSSFSLAGPVIYTRYCLALQYFLIQEKGYIQNSGVSTKGSAQRIKVSGKESQKKNKYLACFISYRQEKGRATNLQAK